MNHKLITKYFLYQWFTGICFSSFIFIILTKLKMGRIDVLDLFLVVMIIICSLILYAQSNIYINKSRLDLVYKIFLHWTFVLATCVLILFFLKISHNFSRLVLLQLYAYGYILQLISFLIVKKCFKSIPDTAKYSLVVGENNFTNNFSQVLLLKRNERLIGYIDEISNMVHIPSRNTKSAKSEQINICSLKLVDDLHVSKIYLSHSQNCFKKVIESYHRYSNYPVDVIWHLLIDEKEIDSSLIMMDGFPFIQMSASPNQFNPLFQIFRHNQQMNLKFASLNYF